MYYPRSTYRIQFNKSFTFKDLMPVIPYLDSLGVKTIYASPIFDAVPGSVHGYDGTDPNRINPEIGSYEELKEIASQLKKRGMGWIQDFVPNHMAYSGRNKWLSDFLEKGHLSFYDGYFDTGAPLPVMAPFLGTSLETAIEKGQIEITFSKGKLGIKFNDATLPLNLSAYQDILNHALFVDSGFDLFKKELRKMAVITDKSLFNAQWEKFQKHLNKKISHDRYHHFEEKLQQLSKHKAFIRQMLDRQYYRLCNWRETNETINYRRFFTVNGLICINMQKQEVFDDYHQLLAKLVKEEVFQGVRIDHIDGLYDPGKYLCDLRKLLGEEIYIVVEKILGTDETIPGSWPVQGTTGYDFLAQVNNVLTNEQGIQAIMKFYDDRATHENNAAQLIKLYKDRFLRSYMRGEWTNLLAQLRSATVEIIPKEVTDKDLRELIAGILVYCPVYRFYIDTVPFRNTDKVKINALMKAIESGGRVPAQTIRFFRKRFINNIPADEERRAAVLHFWRRCMQFSGPLMAKGIEDTLAYNYNAFLANNEVGNEIHSTGINTTRFHELMKERAVNFPLSMNATATHDTKRGEDSRSRLQCLSAHPEAWLKEVRQYLSAAGGADAADRYFILQILYSSFDADEDVEAYKTRLREFIIKAAREASRHSGWYEPDEAYEEKLIAFSFSVLDNQTILRFLKKHKEVIAIQGLTQLTLKCLCPGIPDIYQGTEFHDFSFVDPDNRRPVDFNARMAALQKIMDTEALPDDSTTPHFKMFILYKLLQLRKEYEKLFKNGAYHPINISGSYISFCRSRGTEHLIVVLPFNTAQQTEVVAELPTDFSGNYKNIFTGELIDISKLNITAQIKQFPLLVMISQSRDQERKSGILLPLFSLPSEFGIGGLGKEAHDFVSTLAYAKQKLWQLLPLNPVQEDGYYSPYACVSAFAGDAMYIDPVLLEKEGLVSHKDIKAFKRTPADKIHYSFARKAKAKMLDKAWIQFKEDGHTDMEAAFRQFCEEEKGWLDDYALFVIITQQYDYKPWFQWPQPLRNREAKALAAMQASHEDAYNFERWKQFLFFMQWRYIKQEANRRGICLVGDIPFYLSHNSTDVWANQSLFSLDENGAMTYSAGVPPDYFSETGQLWMMPTYNWKAVRKNNFAWWLSRLKQNVKLFDIVRLDHFRAFYDYWEVPAGHKNAINGQWKDGPREQLFDLIRQHFPDMPFIAEDLGEIHQGVFDFRDRYKLKGMRILQFGFDPFEKTLRDLPNNFNSNTVVYTGTHDNNTTMGWYKNLNKTSKDALSNYVGQKINKGNVNDTLIRMAHQSAAAWSVIPAQDILQLDESARLNMPGTVKHNWLWQLLPGELTEQQLEKLKEWTELYNR